MDYTYAIQTNHLHKSYGKSRGITDLNLEVKRGDFFGFIGPNGAGKSTTIRCLLGLITPDSGEAFLCGMPCGTNKVKPAEQAAVLRKIGYMPSESNYYDRMSVCDIIRFSADLRGVNCNAKADEFIERLQLDTKKKVSELSLGNKKKVNIICAIQHEPELLILDEPTSGLDPLMQQEFFKILKEQNEKGATVFLSSHVLSEIQKYCRNAAIIKEGEIIRVGNVEELGASNVKRIHLTTKDGVEDYLYKDSVDKLIKSLSSREVLDLTITEPTLDEVVLHYYSEK